MDAMNDMFKKWAIDERTSRSKAQHKKKQATATNDMCLCIVCSTAFNDRKGLRKHILKIHKADKEALKEEFKEAKQHLQANPNGLAEQRNYKLALAKLTTLEKLFQQH